MILDILLPNAGTMVMDMVMVMVMVMGAWHKSTQALIVSKELPEDDARLGAKQLHEAIAGTDASIFCGITCGLSAPYVPLLLPSLLARLSLDPSHAGSVPRTL